MRNPTVPTDEIALYALARMYNQHTLVYTRSSIWSTVASSTPLTYSEVCNECQIRLVFLGKGQFFELIKKPVAQSTSVPFAHAVNVYDSGYYEPITNTNPPPQQPSVSMEPDQMLGANIPEENLNLFDEQNSNTGLVGIPEGSCCPVHGCDTSTLSDATNIKISNTTVEVLRSVEFPDSYEVCKTSPYSSLTTYNPLKENEPNLDMTDTNSFTDEMSPITLTKDCIVKLRKLSAADIDFLSRPRLLPSLKEQNDISTNNKTFMEVKTKGQEVNIDNKFVQEMNHGEITDMEDCNIAAVSAPQTSGR